MKEILEEALKGIKPSEKEEKETKEKIIKVMGKIQKALPECKVILGGSGEKGTWLSRAHDADIFVKFPMEKFRDRSDELSDILDKRLKNIFKIRRLHGSRDYFQTEQEGFTFEIVPIIDIKKADDALNITDISPLHAGWVKRYAKYADDIRLTKQFFKAAKVYGAESYIRGFSGYICEILTINYKGFVNLVKAIARWKPKVIIDVESYHKGKNILFEIDKAKTQGPLVIIDPVQAGRNAAAAVSDEKFKRIVEYSNEFLKQPRKSYFETEKIDAENLRKKAGNNELFILEAEPKEGKEDVIGCKILKCFDSIKRELQRNDFKVLFSDWEWQKNAFFYFIIKKEKLSDKKQVRGPPKNIKHYSEQFRKKHKDVFEKGKFLWAREKRRFLTAHEFLKELLKDKYIKEKVKDIRIKR